jgi:hypothetical protein
MSKTRAIRLTDQEDKLIEEFLKKNPFFDFSGLARTAILNFIQQPSVQIRPIKPPKSRNKNQEVLT